MNMIEIFICGYLLVGIGIVMLMIMYYRPDGQTKRKNELYWAVFGVLIFPILIVKFIVDLIKK